LVENLWQFAASQNREFREVMHDYGSAQTIDDVDHVQFHHATTSCQTPLRLKDTVAKLPTGRGHGRCLSSRLKRVDWKHRKLRWASST